MQASERTSGRLSQNALPGLKSVASAISAPASASARAGGIGRPRKSALAGRSTPTTSLDGERGDAGRARRLEMVDRARTELDRERDRARLGELVAVQSQRKARRAAGLEVAARLVGVERAPLEEDVGRLGERGRLGQDLGEQEVEVGVGVVELGRHRVRAEPGRHAAGRADGAKLGELGVVVEAVARLSPRTSSSRAPASTLGGARRDPRQLVLAGCARRADRREDAAARRVQLLVARRRPREARTR